MNDTNTGHCANHAMDFEQRCPECHDESVLAALRGEPTPRKIDNEDLCVWACGTYCTVDEVEQFTFMSDDYRIVPWDSAEARTITGE